MDLLNKLVQMFIVGTEGGGYKKLLPLGLGGVIFFTHDIENVEQFSDLINDITLEALISPFLSIDQEGGRVERTQNIHNGKKYLSAKFAFEKGENFLKEQTVQIAKELRQYGINLNFAPCIDVNTNPNNPIIGERAFSSDVDEVIKGAKIVCDTYRENKIIPCVKHFPGHGVANADSHLTLPNIDLSLDIMEKYHIKPFKVAIDNGIEMIMVAHLNCKCLDSSGIPTSLSKKAISYLRNDLGFDGVIVSDDMEMNGVKQYSTFDAIKNGILAGVNLFIFRNSTNDLLQVIYDICELANNMPMLKNQIEISYNRIMELKRKNIFTEFNT